MSASEQPQENTPVAMLWDFFGPNRAQTAEHHLIHLNEFATLKQLTPLALEVLQQQERCVLSRPMSMSSRAQVVLPTNVIWLSGTALFPVLHPQRRVESYSAARRLTSKPDCKTIPESGSISASVLVNAQMFALRLP